MKKSTSERIKKFYERATGFAKKRLGVFALFFCLLAVGVAVAAAFLGKAPEEGRHVNDSTDERLEDAMKATQPPTSVPDSEEPAESKTPAPVQTVIPDFTKAPNESSAPGVKDLLSPPVMGAVIWGYAMDELIYSETLDQWMVHAGVDIACDKGAVIRSVEAGRIERVYEDSELGYTVIVEHEGGVRSVYAGLSAEGLASEGAKVAKNGEIGVCGDTAASECALEPHIHFEYHIGGKPVDPSGYVLFTS